MKTWKKPHWSTKYFCEVQGTEIIDLKIWIIPLKEDEGGKEIAMPLLQISMENVVDIFIEEFWRWHEYFWHSK